jgi:hypothetical protein
VFECKQSPEKLCSSWLFIVVAKAHSWHNYKTLHPYKTNPFSILGSKKLILQVASRSGNAYISWSRTCVFMGVVCSNVNVSSQNNKYCFFPPNLHLQFIKVFTWPYNRSLVCYVVCKAIWCMFMEIWTLFFSELKKVEKYAFHNWWMWLFRLPYWNPRKYYTEEEKKNSV